MAQMRDRVSSDAVRRVAEITAEVLRNGSFEDSKQALNDKFIEQIKELVSAMPSDILNMNELKKLDNFNKERAAAERRGNEEAHADNMRDLYLMPQ